MPASVAARMANNITAGRVAGAAARATRSVGAAPGTRAARSVLSSGRRTNPSAAGAVTSSGRAGASSGASTFWSRRTRMQKGAMIGGGAFLGGNMVGGSSGSRGRPAPRSSGGM